MTSEEGPEKIADSEIFTIVADWGRRAEPPESLAARLIAMIEGFRLLHPEFEQWLQTDEHKEVVPFDSQLDTQVRRIIGHMSRRPSGELVPEAGVTLVLASDVGPLSDEFLVTMSIGADNDFHDNVLTFGSNMFAAPDPELVGYDVFRGALLAMAESFEVTHALAYPDDLSHLWPSPGKRQTSIQLAWMSYVAPRFAPLVTPPPTAIVEYRPDGGLFMAATDETFRTANPAHLAVARDMKAAVARYNAVPWTVGAGK